MEKQNVAVIGLGVMGANLLQNLESKGFSRVGLEKPLSQGALS